MKEFKRGTICLCPHCGMEQDGPVEEYTIPRKINEETYAEEECIECYRPFYAIRKKEDTFVVGKV